MHESKQAESEEKQCTQTEQTELTEQREQTEQAQRAKEAMRARVCDAKERIDALQKRLTERDELDDEAPQLLKVALRLPDGSRRQMMFAKDDRVASLFDFALSEEPTVDGELIEDIELVRSYPKRIFSQNDAALTLQDAGIESNTLLIVN